MVRFSFERTPVNRSTPVKLTGVTSESHGAGGSSVVTVGQVTGAEETMAPDAEHSSTDGTYPGRRRTAFRL